MMRVCNKCGVEKSLEEFAKNSRCLLGRGHTCEECQKKIRRDAWLKWIEVNREEKREYRSNYYQDHKEEELSRYYNDRDNKLEQQKIRSQTPEAKVIRKQWENSYYSIPENKEKSKEQQRINKEKLRKNPDYILSNLLRGRIRTALKGKGKKSSKSMILVGCDLNFLKDHLQKTAINNGYLDFDINNYSGKDYHIDHLIPCDSFNLKCSYHQYLCFNWSNLQILDATTNILKGKKMINSFVHI